MDIIQKKREVINELVRKYEGDKLKVIDFISSDVLFENTGYGYTFALSKEILSKLDFTGISFDNFNASGYDFSNLTGISLNPQTVFNKSLKNSKLSGVNFIGGFDDVNIVSADFTGSKNAVINPQTIKKRDLYNTKLDSTYIIGSLSDCSIVDTNFKGVLNDVYVNPQTISGKSLHGTILDGVTIIGNYDGTKLFFTDFTVITTEQGCINGTDIKENNSFTQGYFHQI